MKILNNKNKEIGHIYSFYSGVARIQGLPHVFLHELLLDLDNNPVAIVVGFDQNFVEALFFNEQFDLEKSVFRSFKIFSIKISNKYIGRVVNGLGMPRDGLGSVTGKNSSVFKTAPTITEREPITSALSTGIKIIDTNLPLGKGQRELIIGDRKIGKSTIAIDTVLNQKNKNVYCIYVLCGQDEKKVIEIIRLFKEKNAFLYTTLVVASKNSSFAEQYLAPFVGTRIGEYFRDRGKDALIVYDDLSKHAKVYRDMSLLFQRVPGREAYPGDIFSLHAGLLERSAKLSKAKGGGSLSSLPIIETQEGDVTSFIPTNIISITDGQIYLESSLFQKGFLPAINVGLSVSRVGSQTQNKLLRKVVGGIRLALSQHRELQKLSQLENSIDIKTQKKIHRGDLLLELLKQEKHTNVSEAEQIILFYIIEEGYFDDLEKDKWHIFEIFLLELIKNHYASVLERINSGIFNKEVKNKIKKIIDDSQKEFLFNKNEI